MTLSLRARLVLGVVAGMAALLAVFGGLVYALARSSLQAEFDSALSVTARALVAASEVEDGKLELDIDPNQMPEFQRPGRPAYFEFLAQDGTCLIRSRSLGKSDLPPLRGEGDGPAFRHAALPDGRPGRLCAVALPARPEENGRPATQPKDAQPLGRNEAYVGTGPVTVVVARDTLDLDARLAALRWVLLGAGSAALLGAVVLGTVAVRGGLRPLRTLAGRIAAFGEDDLAARFPDEPAPAELLPIRQRLNGLLGRLQTAFDRERSFTANVAHELRTPLAGLRSITEVALSRKRPAEEHEEALSDCLTIAVRMQAMIEQLLALARLESQRASLSSEPVGLAEVVEACWTGLAEQAAARRLTWRCRVPADPACLANREWLTMAIRELLGNAVRYADEGGSIELEAVRQADEVRLTVSNTGCTLAPEQARRVFEPFWRGDVARSGGGRHAGLGLALVRRVIRAMGGTIAAEAGPAGRFIIHLTLPAA